MSETVKIVREREIYTNKKQEIVLNSEFFSLQQQLIDILYGHLDDQESIIESMANFINSKQLANEYKMFVKHSIEKSQIKAIHIVK